MSEMISIPLPDSNGLDLIISVARPEDMAAPCPAVMVFPTWAGRNDFVDQKAQQLAELGYIGIAMDVYGGGRVGANPDECAAMMNPLLANRSKLRARLLTLLDGIRSHVAGIDPGAIAAIGFCFGGLCALDLARCGADVRGVVSFHGLFHPPPADLAEQAIQAKILALHGYDDPMVPAKQVINLAEELSAANADWQIHAYGGTMHAFTNPLANDREAGTVYDATANRRAWQTMREFLNELFTATTA